MAKVNPGTLSLSGRPGEILEGEVSVTPAEGYPFSITQMSQKYGKNIQAELLPPKQGSDVWKIRVRAESAKADDLYDIITIKTDSPYKPELKIRVYAIYFEAPENQS